MVKILGAVQRPNKVVSIAAKVLRSLDAPEVSSLVDENDSPIRRTASLGHLGQRAEVMFAVDHEVWPRKSIGRNVSTAVVPDIRAMGSRIPTSVGATFGSHAAKHASDCVPHMLAVRLEVFSELGSRAACCCSLGLDRDVVAPCASSVNAAKLAALAVGLDMRALC